MYAFIVCNMAMIFFVVAIIISFHAYREFKAMLVESGMEGMGSMFNRGGQAPNAGAAYQRAPGGDDEPEEQRRGNYQAFSGRGVALG